MPETFDARPAEPHDGRGGNDDDELDPNHDLGVDSNGLLTERAVIAGREVIVHYDDIPDTDVTVVGGTRCTTALRTVIDIAADLSSEDLARVVEDCLERGLFTVAEAKARIAEDDMQRRLGAVLLGRVLAR